MRSTANTKAVAISAKDKKHLEQLRKLLSSKYISNGHIRNFEKTLNQISSKEAVVSYTFEYGGGICGLFSVALSVAFFHKEHGYLDAMLKFVEKFKIDINSLDGGKPILTSLFIMHPLGHAEYEGRCETLNQITRNEIDSNLLSIVRKLIQQGASLSGGQFVNPLTLAVLIGSLPLCNTLLKEGHAEPNAREAFYGWKTVAHLVAIQFIRQSLFELTGVLYTQNSAIRYIEAQLRENNIITYPHQYYVGLPKESAPEQEALECLYEKLSEKNAATQTNPYIIIFKLLLNYGAQLYAIPEPSEFNCTISSLLALNNSSMNQMIMDYCREKCTTADLTAILALVIAYKYPIVDEIFEVLKNKCLEQPMMAEEKEILFLFASIRGQYGYMLELLKDGVAYNTQDTRGHTALHHLLWQAQNRRELLDDEKYFNVVSILMSLGADVCIKNRGSVPAINIMMKINDSRINTLILKYCHDAELPISKLIEIYKEIRRYKNEITQDVFDIIYKRLIESNSPTDLATLLRMSILQAPERIQVLIDMGAEINDCSSNASPLLVAIRNQNYAAIEILIQEGADPNLEVNGSTPISAAIEIDDVTALNLLASSSIELDINKRASSDNLSPVALAAREQSDAALAWLLERGATVEGEKIAEENGWVESVNTNGNLPAEIKSHPLCQAIRGHVSQEYFRKILERLSSYMEITNVTSNEVSSFINSFMQFAVNYQSPEYIGWLCDFIYANTKSSNPVYNEQQLHHVFKKALYFARDAQDGCSLKRHIEGLIKEQIKLDKQEKEKEKEKEKKDDAVDESVEMAVENFIHHKASVSGHAYCTSQFGSVHAEELMADAKAKHKQEQAKKMTSNVFGFFSMERSAEKSVSWFDGQLVYHEDTDTLKQITGVPNCYLWIPEELKALERCPREDMETFLGREAKFEPHHVKPLRNLNHTQDISCHGIKYEGLVATHELKIAGEKRLLLYKLPGKNGEPSLYIALKYKAKGLHEFRDDKSLQQSEKAERKEIDLTHSLMLQMKKAEPITKVEC